MENVKYKTVESSKVFWILLYLIITAYSYIEIFIVGNLKLNTFKMVFVHSVTYMSPLAILFILIIVVRFINALLDNTDLMEAIFIKIKITE